MKSAKEIHVSWTALAKIRAQEAEEKLKEISIAVNLLGRGIDRRATSSEKRN